MRALHCVAWLELMFAVAWRAWDFGAHACLPGAAFKEQSKHDQALVPYD
jgi:hypothetical protein